MYPRTVLLPAVCTGVLVFLLFGSAAAQKKWSVETVITQATLQDVSISPDGSRAVWVKRSPDLEKDRAQTDIFLSFLNHDRSATAAESVQLTRTGNNTTPQFSPDGNRIAFSSTRPDAKGENKGAQIWIMDRRGGEPFALTSVEGGVNDFRWKGAKQIVFTAREGKTEFERQLEKSKDDALAVEDSTLFWPVRLFSIDTESKETKRLTSNSLQVGEFAVSPDGRYVAYAENRSPTTSDARILPKQYLLDLETGSSTEIFTEDRFAPTGFQWTLDGSGFFATEMLRSDPVNRNTGVAELYYFDVATGEHEKVGFDWDWGMGAGGYAVTKNGILVQLAAGPVMKPRHYSRTRNGWRNRDLTDFRLPHTTSVTVGPDGETVVLGYSRADSLPQYLYGKLGERAVTGVKTLTELNTHLKDLQLARAEVIEWAGYGGNTVNGILYYPHDYQPGRAYPLIVSIRGGPAAVDLDAWRENWSHYPNLLASRGVFVLRPNYHGSAHHGLEFVESIRGRYYELEVPDIVNGVEHLIASGKVDRDSLGVMGWSNGAILTTALTVEYPDMFKAAAPGAGDVNWISDYGNCAFGVTFNTFYFGGAPWEVPDVYVEKSPLFRMTEVRTPTLITFGDADTAVPTEQGWQHFRALQQIGKAPVRFVLFPEQPHSLLRMSHQRRKIEEELAWFDRYLFGTKTLEESLAERVVRKDSPLALLARRHEIARSGAAYGRLNSDRLVPEIVAVNDTLKAGRFEVTRAQFQAFRPDFEVEAGRENYPATGISFADAKAYAEWLSTHTGRTYRLPTVKEAEVLRKLAGPSENNLAHWLGYAPTVDEQEAATARISRENPDDMLMPVGSRPPGNSENEDAPLLYDLNGNAAEWAVDEDGDGLVVSASAATVVDGRDASPKQAPAGFTGFRVVQDP